MVLNKPEFTYLADIIPAHFVSKDSLAVDKEKVVSIRDRMKNDSILAIMTRVIVPYKMSVGSNDYYTGDQCAYIVDGVHYMVYPSRRFYPGELREPVNNLEVSAYSLIEIKNRSKLILEMTR